MIDLSTIKVLTWDIGGTVFDWRGTVQNEIKGIADAQGVQTNVYEFASKWRYGMFKMLADVRKGIIPHMNADEIHRKMLDTVLDEHTELSLNENERDHLNTIWNRLNAWPDAPAAIEKLRERYIVIPLTVLSWSIGVKCSKHNGIVWDGLLSCEFLKQYKPDPGAYIHASELIGVNPSEIMMCAAHTRDLRSAMSVGYHSVFIYRAGEKSLETMTEEPTEPLEFFDVTARNYAELVEKLME